MKQTDVIQFVTALQKYYADLSNHKNPSQRDDRLSALADTLGCAVEDISEPAGFAKVVENVKSNLSKLVSYGAEETAPQSNREPSDAGNVEVEKEKYTAEKKVANEDNVAQKGDKLENADKKPFVTDKATHETQHSANEGVNDTSGNTVLPHELASDDKSGTEKVNNQPLFDTNIFRGIV